MNSTVPARSFAVVVMALLLLAVGLPGTASAAAAKPVGKLESVHATAFSNTVVLTGWAMDPSARHRPMTVLVTVDGKKSGDWRAASLTRTDVNRAYSATGGHGYSLSTTVPNGHHIVCLTARGAAATTPTASLGCFAFQAYPVATKAQVLAIAKTIDPKGTIAWSFTPLPTGTSGRALPWNKTIQISTGNTTRYLRAVMLHEWSHVLQYRAFGTVDPWWDAVQAFNSLLGHPSDRSNYDGVEHGADCIAAALGANYLGYGCPTTLRVYGARIARGVLMNRPTGAIESVKVSAATAIVTGWAIDPDRPTTSSRIQLTDNGRPVTGWTTASLSSGQVNSSLGVTGGHGFSLRLALVPGSHRICLSAAAVTIGRPTNVVAACSTVAIR